MQHKLGELARVPFEEPVLTDPEVVEAFTREIYRLVFQVEENIKTAFKFLQAAEVNQKQITVLIEKFYPQIALYPPTHTPPTDPGRRKFEQEIVNTD